MQQWGIFREQQRSVEVHQQPMPSDEDLLGVAAMYTLLRRGTIYAVPPHQMPDRTQAAAILRY